MLKKIRAYYKDALKVSLVIALLAGAYVGFGHAERYRSQTRQWETLFNYWANVVETQRKAAQPSVIQPPAEEEPKEEK